MAAKIWTGLGADNNWSTALNWDLAAVPATTDTITFDVTSVKNCTIDALGTWSGGTFTVGAAYTGSITQNVAITCAAFSFGAGGAASVWTQNANFTCTTFAVTTAVASPIVTGFFRTAGTFQCSTFTLSAGKVSLLGAGSCLCTGAVTISATVAPGISTHVVAPPGIWECRGSWSQTGVAADLITFDANGGTIQFSGGAKTINVPSIQTFNLCTFPNATGTQTVSADNRIPLGTNPTIVGGAFSLSGDIEVDGTLTVDNATAITFGAGSSLTGTVDMIVINEVGADITFNATATGPGHDVNITLVLGGGIITSTVVPLGTLTAGAAASGGFTLATGTTIKVAAVTQ